MNTRYDADVQEAALRLVGAGFTPVLIAAGEQRPLLTEWQTFHASSGPLSEEDMHGGVRDALVTSAVVRDWWSSHPGAGLGVACGDDVVAVDVDADDIVAGVLAVVPRTPCAKFGSKGLTLFYRNPERLRSEDFKRPDRSVVLQILAAGKQTVIPPTTHPKVGRPYEWRGQPLWECARELPALTGAHRAALERLAVAAGCVDKFAALVDHATPGPAAGDAEVTAERPRYVGAARGLLRHLAADLAATPAGGRNLAVFQAGADLAPRIRAGLLDAAEVRRAILEACRANGLVAEDGERSCVRSIESGLHAGWNAPLPQLPTPPMPTMPPAPLPPSGQQQPQSWQVEWYDGRLPTEEPEMIERIIPATSGLSGLLAGQSGAGKSLLGVGIAVAVAGGLPKFLDLDVYEHGPVIYVAAEGQGTIIPRIHAAVTRFEIKEPPRIAVVKGCPDLKDPAARSLFTTFLRSVEASPRLVIIDTLAAAFALIDEQSNSEAATVMKGLAEMAAALRCVTLTIHHMGKDQASGPRGASNYRGLADFAIYLPAERNEVEGVVRRRRVVIGKSRTGPEGMVCGADLEVVNLGMTSRGKVRTEAVLVKTDICDQPRGGNAFDEAFQRASNRCASTNVPCKIVEEEFKRAYVPDSDDPKKAKNAARMAWQRSHEQAIASGKYTALDGVFHKITNVRAPIIKFSDNHPVANGAIR